MQGEIADEGLPVIEKDEAEAVEEAAADEPGNEALLILTCRGKHLAHRADSDVDEAEDEKQSRDIVLERLEPLRDELHHAVKDFLDGIGEVVEQFPFHEASLR